jgi:hypothetical protein
MAAWPWWVTLLTVTARRMTERAAAPPLITAAYTIGPVEGHDDGPQGRKSPALHRAWVKVMRIGGRQRGTPKRIDERSVKWMTG